MSQAVTHVLVGGGGGGSGDHAQLKNCYNLLNAFVQNSVLALPLLLY